MLNNICYAGSNFNFDLNGNNDIVSMISTDNSIFNIDSGEAYCNGCSILWEPTSSLQIIELQDTELGFLLFDCSSNIVQTTSNVFDNNFDNNCILIGIFVRYNEYTTYYPWVGLK